MTIDELKSALGIILAEEEDLKWEEVEALSEQTYIRLTTEGDTPQDYAYETVISYLAGFLRRQTDEHFAVQQRQWLRQYLQGEAR